MSIKTYEKYMRQKKMRSRNFILLLSTLLLLSNIILDIFRLFYIFSFKISGYGKKIIFVSNTNQVINIHKYLPDYSQDFKLFYVKNSKKLISLPQAYFHFKAILNILFFTKSPKKLSHLDVDNLRFKGSSLYFCLYLKFIGTKKVIISREDISPYIDIALACQKLRIKLVVVEHGIFFSESFSFAPTETTLHIFSSEVNILKRHPKPKIVYKAESPLKTLYDSFLISKANASSSKSILLADTFNIRHLLLNIAESIEDKGAIFLRLHPGYSIKDNKFLDKRPKIEALADAQVVVTGISGFAMESIFCGIPTIILTTPEDEWAFKELSIYDRVPFIKILDADKFMKNSSLLLSINQPSYVDIKKVQDSLGFSKNQSQEQLLEKWLN